MNCKGPSSVFDLLDSEASPSEASDMASHLEDCSDCRGRHQFYSQLKQQVREGHGQSVLPELSRARILKALQAAQAPAKSAAPSRRVWGAGLAAAAGFLLFSAVALVQSPPSSSQQLATALASDHLKCSGAKQPQAYGSSGAPVLDPVQVAQKTFHKTPDMASFPNLAPLHCQVCAIDPKRTALHVVYRHPSSDQMVSMFGMPIDNQNDFGLPESQESVEPHVLPNTDHNLVAWRHNGWVYSLVSDMAPNQLAQLAREGRYLARARWAPPLLPNSPNPYDGLARPASFQR